MGLNEVFKKVTAINEVTELAKHEVELGAIQELEKKVAQFQSDNDKVTQLIKNLDSVKNQFKQLDKKLSVEFKSLRGEADKLFEQASSLGLETKIPFQLGAKVAKIYGENWDMDAIKFLRS
jgi:type VII secretion effector (TIGR04197 family)